MFSRIMPKVIKTITRELATNMGVVKYPLPMKLTNVSGEGDIMLNNGKEFSIDGKAAIEELSGVVGTKGIVHFDECVVVALGDVDHLS